LLFLSTVSVHFALGQTQDVLLAMSKQQRIVGAVDATALPGRTTLSLEMPYAKSNWSTTPSSTAFKEVHIERIDLVYTAFSIDPQFDQKGLNKERVKQLLAAFPSLGDQPYIEWGAQAIANLPDRATAQQQFHGFVITYRNPTSAATVQAELTFLDELLTQSVQRKMADSASTSETNRGAWKYVLLETNEMHDFGRMQMRTETVAKRYSNTDFGDFAYNFFLDALFYPIGVFLHFYCDSKR